MSSAFRSYSNAPPCPFVLVSRVQSPDVYDTLAYEVQGMLSAQSLLFPTGFVSSLNNPPESPLVVPSIGCPIAAV
jgi:hypothetical protein